MKRTVCPVLSLLLFTPLLSGQDSAPSNIVRLETGVTGHIHPSLAITPKGTLIGAFCKNEYKPYLLTRSTDGGKTWSKPIVVPGTENQPLYPGSLTTLADGRVVLAWNSWFTIVPNTKSRYVTYTVSADEGMTWSEPKHLAKAKKEEKSSVIRHPFLELSPRSWLFSLWDRTVLYDPTTGQESAFGDSRIHGLVPIVRTPTGTLVSGKGLRSTDGGKTWDAVKGLPDLSTQGWRQQMVALKNGVLLASQSVGPGIGGDKIHFILSHDDGKTWDSEHPIEFYNPGRPIGGRACPRTVEIDKDTLGTIFYDTDTKQPGGSGVFFRTTSMPKPAK